MSLGFASFSTVKHYLSGYFEYSAMRDERKSVTKCPFFEIHRWQEMECRRHEAACRVSALDDM
jgi:hypothetical protein